MLLSLFLAPHHTNDFVANLLNVNHRTCKLWSPYFLVDNGYMSFQKEVITGGAEVARRAARNNTFLPMYKDVNDDGQICISSNFILGGGNHILRGSRIYPSAARRISQLLIAMQKRDVRLFLGMHEPSIIVAEQNKWNYEATKKSINAIMTGRNGVWIDLIERLRFRNPSVEFVVWCDEDKETSWLKLIDLISPNVEGDSAKSAWMDGNRKHFFNIFSQLARKEHRRRGKLEAMNVGYKTSELLEAYRKDVDKISCIDGVILI